MANTLLTPTMITRESLRVLKNELTFTKNVNTYYEDEFAKPGMKIGATLQIRKPVRFTERSGRVAAIQDVTETTTVLTIANQTGVDFQFTSADMTLTIDKFSDRYIVPAMATIANGVDRRGLQLANSVWNAVGTPGTIPSSTTPYLNAMAVLDANSAPKDGNRAMIIGPFEQASLLDSVKGLFNPATEISDQYKTGNLGRAFGFKWSMDQNVVAHTIGAYGGTPAVNGAGQTGNTLVVNGFSAASTLTLGDVFTIAGVFGVNVQSRQTTNKLQQFVVTAPFTADGTGAGSIGISPSITAVGAYQNATNSPANGALITVLGAANTVTDMNLAFHKDAFTLAALPMEVPKGVDMGMQETDPDTGLSIRFVRSYDVINDLWISRFDMLYGWAATYPELAVRVQG